MANTGKKIIRRMRESECGSFEQACSELVDVLGVNSHSKSPPKRAIPLSVTRWNKWLYAVDDMWFSTPDVSLLRDASAGLRSLRDPVVGLNIRCDAGLSWIGSITVRSVLAIPNDRRFLAPAGAILVGQRLQLPYVSGHVQTSAPEDFYVLGERGLKAVMQCRKSVLSRRELLEEESESIKRIELFLSYRLTMRYEWQIEIGEPGGASAMFPISRAECAAAFASRDALPGRSRRSALRHFVEKHARRRASDPHGPSDVDVRRYLRGQTSFSWNGLACEIIPPAYEMEAIERVRAQRVLHST